jgi:hypothetical protein
MYDQSAVVPQSKRVASKQPLDGRIRFNTIEAALLEAYDGAVFYILSLQEWYKFKSNGAGGFTAMADSAIDASQFATKTELNTKANNTIATESAAGLMSATNFVKLRDINPSNITKVAASATNGNIRINDAEVNVYTRPNNENDRPVNDLEKSTWNSKADGVHVHNNYSPTTHNHDNVYAQKEHEHQVWDAVLGRYREKYVLANSQGGGGDATSLSGLALNNNATGEVASDAIWSASKVLGVVNGKVSELATGLSWKAAVNTFNEIATTYTNPVDGWTVITKDDDKTWRFNGTEWVDISVTIIPLATQSVDGKMSAGDKTKLDGIAENANNYTHPENHLASMIVEVENMRFVSNTEKQFLGDNVATFSGGTYTKVAADYPEGRFIRECFENVDLNAGANALRYGFFITYVSPGRTYAVQFAFFGNGYKSFRTATTGAWGTWQTYYHSLNLTAATQSVTGLMAAADKTKLDGVASGATNTPLGSTNPAALGTASPGVSTSAARADHVHPLPNSATQSVAGLMAAADKTKLDGVASGATNTPLGSTNPAALGTAAPGVSTSAARADHIHPLPTSPTFSGTVTASKILARKVPVVQTLTSQASVSLNCDSYDGLKITAQAEALTFAAPTGTPSDMQTFAVRLKDNGTSKAISWNAAFVAMGVALPTATVAGKKMSFVFMYDSDLAKWGLVSLAKEA